MATDRMVKGCCPLDCQDTCSWLAEVKDGRVVRVEGSKDHPFTRGSLCAKVSDYERRTYSKDRLLRPLQRVGPKGAGDFEPVPWDAALDRIAERFSDIVATHGSEALLPINYLGSMGVVQRRALLRIFHALGASQVHGSICGAASNALEAEGHPRGFDPEESIYSRFILVWGANLLTTCHHHWYFLDQARKRQGARIVCIDPIRTRTAAACDEHLSIRPGSDVALAAGMAHVILAEGRADLEFANQVASDLDEFRRRVEPWSPDRAAEVCGIDTESVIRLAREFADARPALIRAGVGPQQTKRGESFVRSLSALAILGGHWCLRGGGLFIEANPYIHEAKAGRPDLQPRPTRSLDLARLGEHLTSDTLTPQIHGLMAWGINPAVDQPDVKRVRKGLQREDLFTVVVEHFLTDTARYADVVLPSTTQLEHFDVLGAWGHHYISVNNPAVEPVGESKSHGEIMRLLAPRLGLSHSAFRETDEEIATAALPSGIELDALKSKGWWKSSPPSRDFSTAPGELRLVSDLLPPQDAPDGMLQLLTPKAHYFMNSSFANMPRHRRSMRGPTLDMHPHDAESRGLVDGQQVVVRNERGAVRAKLRVVDTIHHGVVAMPGKWWSHPQETGAVGNVLTPSEWSPGGQPAYNDTFVDVIREQPDTTGPAA